MGAQKRYAVIAFLFLFTSFYYIIECHAIDFEGRLIASVEVEGNHWIESKTILHVVQTASGRTYSSRLIRKDLKALYRKGFFEYVEVEAEDRPEVGLTVIFRVKEKPLVTEIVIIGNKKIATDKLREKLTLKNRTILNESKVKRNALLLENEYKTHGYQDVKVEPEYEKTKENEIKVTFNVDEGLEVVIREILFEDNSYFSDKELQKKMKSKPHHSILSIFGSRGKYSEQKLQENIANIEEHYQDHGFIKAEPGQYRIEKLSSKKK